MTMKVSLGPVLYHWGKQVLVDFYQEAKHCDADTIYLGETVCSKRQELSPGEWLELAADLSNCGKQIVLSTLTLLETPADLALLKRYCENGNILVEANDMGAVGLLSEQKLPFVAGSAINCYNAYTLKQLRELGMQRWVMPVELSRQWLVNLLAEARDIGLKKDFEIEVFSYGYLPLAYSARCFTSRHENRPKSDCQQCCIQYPQGLPLKSQDNSELFTINGIQTQSAYCYNLAHDLDSMNGLVDIARISPLSQETLKIVSAFKSGDSKNTDKSFQNPSMNSGLNLSEPNENGLIASDRSTVPKECNGYWHQVEGMKSVS